MVQPPELGLFAWSFPQEIGEPRCAKHSAAGSPAEKCQLGPRQPSGSAVPRENSLTLDLWSNTDGPPCPRCGAAGDAWRVEEPYQEIVVFDCACGSHAEVVDESGYLAAAYRELMASCPVFVPPGPRRRLWENAQ